MGRVVCVGKHTVMCHGMFICIQVSMLLTNTLLVSNIGSLK